MNVKRCEVPKASLFQTTPVHTEPSGMSSHLSRLSLVDVSRSLVLIFSLLSLDSEDMICLNLSTFVEIGPMAQSMVCLGGHSTCTSNSCVLGGED